MYQLNYQSYAQAAAVPQRALQLMAAGCPQEMAQVFCHILAAQPATIAPLELSQQLGLSVLQVGIARQDHIEVLLSRFHQGLAQGQGAAMRSLARSLA